MNYSQLYPDFRDADLFKLNVCEYARLKCEQGSSEQATEIIEETKAYLKGVMERLQAIPDDVQLKACEPDTLAEIKELREKGPRKMWKTLPNKDILQDKTAGALYGRMIGCMLGVPVEGATVEDMKTWCDFNGKVFPPTDYWESVEMPHVRNYYRHYRWEYRKHNMTYVPVDDDVIYTQLALIIMEEYGVDFTTKHVGDAWRKYLPFACTAEEIAINNLNKGVAIENVAEVENPYRQWIGAAIRSDGFAYAAAGYPEKAAEMAYQDAYLSHRRNGIYGEMFLAAAQSAAFAVDDPMEAVKIGMTEIPKDCNLHKDLEWALENCKNVKNYEDARRLVDERFGAMHIVHTLNNMCLIVFGLHIAKKDFVKGISEIVAMGLDNDCTAASAGSILGAVLGKKAIPEYLYTRFNNTIDTYLNGKEKFHFDDMAERFMFLAEKIYEEK